jgi:hypothetical protein
MFGSFSTGVAVKNEEGEKVSGDYTCDQLIIGMDMLHKLYKRCVLKKHPSGDLVIIEESLNGEKVIVNTFYKDLLAWIKEYFHEMKEAMMLFGFDITIHIEDVDETSLSIRDLINDSLNDKYLPDFIVSRIEETVREMI